MLLRETLTPLFVGQDAGCGAAGQSAARSQAGSQEHAAGTGWLIVFVVDDAAAKTHRRNGDRTAPDIGRVDPTWTPARNFTEYAGRIRQIMQLLHGARRHRVRVP